MEQDEASHQQAGGSVGLTACSLWWDLRPSLQCSAPGSQETTGIRPHPGISPVVLKKGTKSHKFRVQSNYEAQEGWGKGRVAINRHPPTPLPLPLMWVMGSVPSAQSREPGSSPEECGQGQKFCASVPCPPPACVPVTEPATDCSRPLASLCQLWAAHHTAEELSGPAAGLWG